MLALSLSGCNDILGGLDKSILPRARERDNPARIPDNLIRIPYKEVVRMKKEVEVINIMADGTICEDLSTYIDNEHPLPEDAQRMILEFMRAGAKIRAGG